MKVEGSLTYKLGERKWMNELGRDGQDPGYGTRVCFI